MATLGSSLLTLVDHAKRVQPNGKIQGIAELLSQRNEVVDDIPWVEGNLPTGHRTVVRTGLPTVAYRLMNAGITPSKSTTAQIDEQCGMLEGWSEVDKDLAELNGDVAAFRLSEDKAFIESMGIKFCSTLFYGNTGLNQEEFTGLSPRYSATSAGNGSNILLGGGAGSDNSSIWLVGWGEQSVHGIYPKGSVAGLQHEDLGLVTVQTATGPGTGRMRAYQSRFQWKHGIALRDWRYAVRIANIDISNLVGKSSAADLIELMIKAIHRIPTLSGVRPVFYMNRSCYQMLDIQRRDDVQTGGQLGYSNVDGVPNMAFRGIPVHRTDALLETEAVVS